MRTSDFRFPHVSDLAKTLYFVFAVALFGLLHPLPVDAQSEANLGQSIAVIDPTRLFEQSDFGQSILKEFQERSEALSLENTAITRSFTAEEADLVEQRKLLPAEEFRPLAEDFDTRVKKSRVEQDQKLKDLNEFVVTKRGEFFDAFQPLLLQFVRSEGIEIVLERNTVIFSAQGADITNKAIALANQRLRIE